MANAFLALAEHIFNDQSPVDWRRENSDTVHSFPQNSKRNADVINIIFRNGDRKMTFMPCKASEKLNFPVSFYEMSAVS